MAESCWPMPVTTQEHLQNLVSQGCMTIAALATYHVLADSASPAQVGGYVLSVLRAMIWHALALVPLLAAAVLWLRAASLDSFGGLAYCRLCDPVRGLQGD
jgi:hypothetical protein